MGNGHTELSLVKTVNKHITGQVHVLEEQQLCSSQPLYDRV